MEFSDQQRLSGSPGRHPAIATGQRAAVDEDEEEGSSIVPPYWRRHRRDVSSISIDTSRPSPIRLEDHTIDGSEQAKALWAKHVNVDDYVIVSGNAPGVGAYVVWSCTVETLDVSDASFLSILHELPLTYRQGGSMKIRKRFGPRVL